MYFSLRKVLSELDYGFLVNLLFIKLLFIFYMFIIILKVDKKNYYLKLMNILFCFKKLVVYNELL